MYIIKAVVDGFLSTLSLRRATIFCIFTARANINFYPRSPCGERLPQPKAPVEHLHISIHALLAESDCCSFFIVPLPIDFYPRSPCGERQHAFEHKLGNGIRFLSTLSLRRATTSLVGLFCFYIISIHALLAESDSKSAQNSGALLRI